MSSAEQGRENGQEQGSNTSKFDAAAKRFRERAEKIAAGNLEDLIAFSEANFGQSKTEENRPTILSAALERRLSLVPPSKEDTFADEVVTFFSGLVHQFKESSVVRCAIEEKGIAEDDFWGEKPHTAIGERNPALRTGPYMITYTNTDQVEGLTIERLSPSENTQHLPQEERVSVPQEEVHIVMSKEGASESIINIFFHAYPIDDIENTFLMNETSALSRTKEFVSGLDFEHRLLAEEQRFMKYSGSPSEEGIYLNGSLVTENDLSMDRRGLGQGEMFGQQEQEPKNLEGPDDIDR